MSKPPEIPVDKEAPKNLIEWKFSFHLCPGKPSVALAVAAVVITGTILYLWLA